MNMKKILMNDECREKLIAGVNLAADVVQVTYGPNGHTVISGDHITKDGMTAVSWVKDDDPFTMMGVNLMKDIARRTAEVAGDGTSTSVLLAREIINTCTKQDIPMLKSGLNIVLDELARLRTFDEEKIETVATISANGDKHIGALITEAFEKADGDGVVTYMESDDVIDHVDFCDGFRIDNGYAHHGFTTTEQGGCELSNVYVHISDTKLSEVKDIIEVADMCMKKGKSLLLIAPDFDSEIYVFLQSNLHLLPSLCVISPSFKKERAILIEDMRILFGEKHLCDKVISNNECTIFLCNRDSEQIHMRVEEIRNILNQPLKEHELVFHKQRLANFTSGIATINVGGYSQFEIKEKLDRIDDAVRAAECATKEGVLAGGGAALMSVVESGRLSGEYSKLVNVLTLPCRLLWEGQTIPSYQELYQQDIIEPYSVVKTALENAVNIAVTILTCDCAILPSNHNFKI
jgi:chaperonin GroEL